MNYQNTNNNRKNLLRGWINLALKKDDDTIKLTNIKLSSFKANIDAKLMNSGTMVFFFEWLSKKLKK